VELMVQQCKATNKQTYLTMTLLLALPKQNGFSSMYHAMYLFGNEMKWKGQWMCLQFITWQQNHNLPCWAHFIPNPMPSATILQHKCVRGMRKDREARLTPQLLTKKLTRSWWWPCCNAM
jgi:hypothetical protein